MKKLLPCLVAVWLLVLPSYGQTTDSLLLRSDPIIAELDSILNSADSLSILDLLDSVLLAPEVDLPSQLAVRLGYNNNVVANGSASITQFGFNGGLSYYHKSGAYADLSTYYSEEYKPSLYLTVAAAGYLATINKNWSILAEYGHFFYTPADDDVDVYTPYTNTLYVSNYVKAKVFVFRFDYNLYFGDLVAHRLTPAIGFNLSKKNWLGMDRITFLPTASLWYGSDNISEFVPNYTTILQRRQLILQGKPLFSERTRPVWGIMNYSLSFPLSFTYANWSMMVSYNLNFQKGLPGESVESSRTGFAGVSLIRYFDL